MATRTLRDLLDSGMSPEEINALLSQSTVSTAGYDPMGTTGRGEPYVPPQPGYGPAGMVEQAPLNTIRNNSTGRTFSPTDMGGQPSQPQGMSGLPLDYSQNPVKTPYGTGQYLKGDSTRMMITDGPQFGKIVDLGRDTAAERASTKDALALDKARADIAHTQMQTDPVKAAEYARQVAIGKQQGEMTGFNTMAQQNATGPNALSGLPPAMADQVKALAEGRMAFPSGFALKSPYWQQMLQLVSQYDPSFDAINYNKRNKTATSFAAGPTADKVRNLNQSLVHAAKLSDNIEALDNSNILPGLVNPVSNLAGERLGGQTAQNNFRQTAQALSSEMRKLFAGVGGGSLTELQKWEDSLPLNAGKEQQKAYLQNGMDLLAGGMTALEGQYKAGMGPNATIDSLMWPKAMEAARKFGLKPELENLSSGSKPKLTNIDAEALAWAMKNPTDHRADEIKAKLGVQ